jgi:hypothetical protein
VIGYVDSNALNGIITKNLFNFKHYILALNVDGKQIPSKPLQPDFSNDGYITMFTLTSTLQMGYLLLVFDVSHPYVRAQLYFSHEEADVLDLVLKGACDTR